MRKNDCTKKPQVDTARPADMTAAARGDGTYFPSDALIVSNAKIVAPDDSFIPPVIRLLRVIMDSERNGKRYKLIHWPDGVVAAIPAGLTGNARERALADVYHRAFQNLLSHLPQ